MKEVPFLKESFAETLRHRREMCGLTQHELASKMDSARSLISFLENAKHFPSLQTFFLLSHVLSVDPLEFLSDITATMERKRLAAKPQKSPSL